MTDSSQRTIFFIIPALVIFLFTSVYIVQEGQSALLLRLGKLVNDSNGQAVVKTSGLHFKIPLINTIKKFDTRVQTLDIESSRIVTAMKKDVLVDYYIKWRINNLPLYYRRTSGNIVLTETLLQQKLNDGLRAEFGKRTIREVVAGKKEGSGSAEKAPQSGRMAIMASLRKQSNESVADLGLQIIDVRIKRIDLPAEVSSAVYERMRAERERVATEHRAEGKAKGEAIRAHADARVTVLLATAQSDAKRIRGTANAKAAQIYASAYQQNPEFFEFYRSLLAYQNSLSRREDLLVLGLDNQFFKYLNRTTSDKRE